MRLAFLVIWSFLSIIGLAHIIMSIIYSFLKIKDDNAIVLVIPQIDKNFDAELTLRSVAAKTRYLGNCGIKEIICIDNGLDSKTKKECELISSQYGYISVMTPTEFKEKAGL